MNGLVKKTIVYSMVGIMQFGMSAAVVNASPLYNDGPQRIVQFERDDR